MKPRPISIILIAIVLICLNQKTLVLYGAMPPTISNIDSLAFVFESEYMIDSNQSGQLPVKYESNGYFVVKPNYFYVDLIDISTTNRPDSLKLFSDEFYYLLNAEITEKTFRLKIIPENKEIEFNFKVIMDRAVLIITRNDQDTNEYSTIAYTGRII